MKNQKKATPEAAVVTPIPGQRHGRQPVYLAKVGTGPGTTVIVKRVRTFHVGQQVEFCETSSLRGTSAHSVAPPWSRGLVERIEGNRLFLGLN